MSISTKMNNSINKKKSPVTSVLGPVENLESYVKAEWWKEIFNANYLRTDGDVVEDKTVTEVEVRIFLEILKPEKTAPYWTSVAVRDAIR